MIGTKYWSVGIVLKVIAGDRADVRFNLRLDFFDDGWCDSESTEGKLRVRYSLRTEPEALAAVLVLRSDAEAIGIEWRNLQGPTVHLEGDGEKLPESNYKHLANQMAESLGWRKAY